MALSANRANHVHELVWAKADENGAREKERIYLQSTAMVQCYVEHTYDFNDL